MHHATCHRCHLPGLSVGIVSRLETQLFNAKLFEELIKHPNQVSQGQVSVSYHPLSILIFDFLIQQFENSPQFGGTLQGGWHPGFHS